MYVEILLPLEGTYELESNLTLTPMENKGGYEGHFPTLPVENLTFTLQDLTAVTQGGATMDYSQVFIFSVAVVLLVGLLLSSITGYRRTKKAYRDALEAQRNQED